jgi:hypothetical protein
VLREAIRQGGISREDFPSAIRRHVFLMSGSPPAELRSRPGPHPMMIASSA